MPEWFITAAAVVGVVGGLAGIVSLVWQIVTWRRSTHKVNVSTAYAFFAFSNGSVSEDLLAVTVRNTGAAPVTVTGWGIEIGKTEKNLTVTSPITGSTPLPHRLENGADMNLHTWTADLKRASAEFRVPFSQMRAWARLGTGQKVYAKRGVQVPS